MKKLYIIVICMFMPVLYGEEIEDTFDEPVAGDVRAPAPAARSLGSAGSVHSISGEAVWYYADSPADKKNAAVRSPVSSNAVFETEPGSWVIIAARDETGYIYLGPDTKAKIIYSTYKQGSHWIRIELMRGTVRACCTKLSKLYSCFAVVTPNASVGTSEKGDILVQYRGGEDGTSGVTAAGSLQGTMSVSHIPISDKLRKPMERKQVEEGNSVKVYTGQRITGSGQINGLRDKQAFWSRHNIRFSGREEISRQKKRVEREIERHKSGQPRLTPHLLAR